MDDGPEVPQPHGRQPFMGGSSSGVSLGLDSPSRPSGKSYSSRASWSSGSGCLRSLSVVLAVDEDMTASPAPLSGHESQARAFSGPYVAAQEQQAFPGTSTFFPSLTQGCAQWMKSVNTFMYKMEGLLTNKNRSPSPRRCSSLSPDPLSPRPWPHWTTSRRS